MRSALITLSLLVLSVAASPPPEPHSIRPKLDPSLKPKLDPSLKPKLDPSLKPKLDQSITPKLDPTIGPMLVATPAPAAPCSWTASMPACGVGCLASAAGVAGCSDLLDFPCQCKASARIHSLASGCVVAACGSATATMVSSVGDAICSQCA